MPRITVKGVTYEFDPESEVVHVLGQDGRRVGEVTDGSITKAHFVEEPTNLVVVRDSVDPEMTESEIEAELAAIGAERDWISTQPASGKTSKRLMDLINWNNLLASALNEMRRPLPEMVVPVEPRPAVADPAPTADTAPPEKGAAPEITTDGKASDEPNSDALEKVGAVAASMTQGGTAPDSPSPVPLKADQIILPGGGAVGISAADVYPGRTPGIAITAAERNETTGVSSTGELGLNQAMDLMNRFTGNTELVGTSPRHGVPLFASDFIRGAINPFTGEPLQVLSSRNSATQNEEIMESQAAAMAVVASECGWTCARPTRDEALPDMCERTDRPILAATRPPQPIGTGVFTFRKPMGLPSLKGSDGNPYDLSLWTASQQDAVDENDSSTWKNNCVMLPAECDDDVQVAAQKLYWCLKFTTDQAIARSDEIQRFRDLLEVMYARRSERFILDVLDVFTSIPGGGLWSHDAAATGLGIKADLEQAFLRMFVNTYQPGRYRSFDGQTMIVGEDLAWAVLGDAMLANELGTSNVSAGFAAVQNWFAAWADMFNAAGVVFTPDYGSAEGADSNWIYGDLPSVEANDWSAMEACPIDGSVPDVTTGVPLPGFSKNYVIRFANLGDGYQPLEQLIHPYEVYRDAQLAQQNCALAFGEIAVGGFYRGCRGVHRIDVENACVSGIRQARHELPCSGFQAVPALGHS